MTLATNHQYAHLRFSWPRTCEGRPNDDCVVEGCDDGWELSIDGDLSVSCRLNDARTAREWVGTSGQRDSLKHCKNIDECAVNNGGCGNGTCEDLRPDRNSDLGYACKCQEFSRSEELQLHASSQCQHTDVGSRCVASCQPGYRPAGSAAETTYICRRFNFSTVWMPLPDEGELVCENIDECAVNNGGCASEQICEDLHPELSTGDERGYRCGECKDGYYEWQTYGVVQCRGATYHASHQTTPSTRCISCSSDPCVASCGKHGVQLRSGYASVTARNSTSTVNDVYRCPNDQLSHDSDATCRTVSITDRVRCARGYTGPLCQACDLHYSRHGHACRPCHRSNEHLIILIVLASLLLFVLAWQCCCTTRKQSFQPNQGHIACTQDNPIGISMEDRPVAGEKQLQHKLIEVESGGQTPSSFMQTSKATGARMCGYKCRWWRMLLRSNAQSVRIVIGFGQVVGQLGSVLHVQYPPGITMLATKLRNIISFDFLQSFECIGLSGFYLRWGSHLFVLPLFASLICIFLWRSDVRTFGAAEAANRLAANGFTAVFLLHPTVSHWAFAAFDCRQLSNDLVVLRTDYRIHCKEYPEFTYPPAYFRCVAVSAMVVVFFVFGVPLYAAAKLRTKSKALRAAAISPQVAAIVSGKLSLHSTAHAAELMHELEFGLDYGFLLSAFRPSCYFWEIFEMLRKLILIGAMVVCAPGSVFQIWVAAMLSVLFLATHFKVWPYKLAVDNILKATVEVLVLVSILVALVLKDSASLDDEIVSANMYDAVLLCSYSLVPVAFLAAALLKTKTALSTIQHTNAENQLSAPHTVLRMAYELHCRGLADDMHTQLLLDLFSDARLQAQFDDLQVLADNIEGKVENRLRKACDDTADSTVSPLSRSHLCWDLAPHVNCQHETVRDIRRSGIAKASSMSGRARKSVARARANTFSDPFSKFSGGFEGTYADTSAFYGASLASKWKSVV
eukprot:SAG31_NODE_396_length_16264_cov_17.206496_16_plen_964_part_00